MGSFDAFQGQVYGEFNRALHVVKPFAIPEGWTRILGHDGGYRNPAATVWGAVDPDDNIYIYREMYEREMLIEEVCKGNERQGRPGIVPLSKGEKIDGIWADPSLRARRGQIGESDWDEYLRNLPTTWSMLPANNDVQLGIDRVKQYLKPDERTGKPRLYIFETCTNLLEEMSKYRWKEKSLSQVDGANEKEEPVKVDDHAVDALRYLLMSRPEGPRPDKERRKQQEVRTAEWYLRQDLERIRKPAPKDPFGDNF